LLREILSYLPKDVQDYADLTLGGGGHAAAILKQFQNARLVGVDQDPEAIQAAGNHLDAFRDRCTYIHSSYSNAVIQFRNNGQRFDFILADLGFSSYQIENATRGFSFLHDGPLDMRMNPDQTMDAAYLVNTASQFDLQKILRQFGEEQLAGKIVSAILRQREIKPFSRTVELAECVKNALPKKLQYGRIHPATKTFQALRIAVNGELEELKTLLENAIDVLRPGGRFGIISFHSLEDRMVKQAFHALENPCNCPPKLPRCICGKVAVVRKLHKKMLQAETDEVDVNPRSRSAKLRIVEKI